MGLSKLPSCFGLNEKKKGYFPHLFNIKDNQNYVGNLPDAKYYSPDSMTTSARTEFLAWHQQNANATFDFKKEMLAYCR